MLFQTFNVRNEACIINFIQYFLNCESNYSATLGPLYTCHGCIHIDKTFYQMCSLYGNIVKNDLLLCCLEMHHPLKEQLLTITGPREQDSGQAPLFPIGTSRRP